MDLFQRMWSSSASCRCRRHGRERRAGGCQVRQERDLECQAEDAELNWVSTCELLKVLEQGNNAGRGGRGGRRMGQQRGRWFGGVIP